MPASLNKYLGLFIVISLLTACARDEDKPAPYDFVDEEEVTCLEGSPYEAFKLIDNVTFTDINYNFSFDSSNYNLDVRNLIHSTNLSAVENTSFLTPEILPSLLDPLDTTTPLLNDKQIERLSSAVLAVSSLEVVVSYAQDGEIVTVPFEDIDEPLTLALAEGNNTINVDVSALIEMPYSGVECSLSDDLTEDEINELKRGLAATTSYVYTIKRDTLEEVQSSNISIDSLINSAEDEIARVISISGDYLAVGVSGEDSDSRGVFLPSELIQANEVDGSNSVNPLVVNSNAENSGAVYVFKKNEIGTGWHFSQFIKSFNADAGDSFGHAISLEGDRLVVSAIGEDSHEQGVFLSSSEQSKATAGTSNLALESGAVYVYERDESDVWTEIAYIKPNENIVANDGYNNKFGHKVVLDKSYLLISAPKEDSANGSPEDATRTDSGAVYMHNASDLVYINTLKANVAGAGDMFGSSLAIDGDYLAVGAPFEDSNSSEIKNNIVLEEEVLDSDPQINDDNNNSGSVYIFRKIGEQWKITTFIKAQNNDSEDGFGSSVAISGSVLSVGAPKEDGAGIGFNRDLDTNTRTDSGAVYTYELGEETDNWTPQLYIKADDSQASSFFGSQIVTDNNDLLVSAPFYNIDSLTNAGKAYFYYYDLTLNEWVFDVDFLGEEDSSMLGDTLAIDNSEFAIGSRDVALDSGESAIQMATVFE
jgi:hypothetical protein